MGIYTCVSVGSNNYEFAQEIEEIMMIALFPMLAVCAVAGVAAAVFFYMRSGKK